MLSADANTPPADLVQSAVERAYRNDLGIDGAKAFTKNLARHDPSGTITRKLATGEPLTPNDRLVISRTYHDSLPMDNLKPPAPEVDNAINNIVRNYSIFSRRMPAGDAFKGALTNTIGSDITDNLLVRIAADPTAPLAKTIENIIFGRQLTPIDKFILGHHIESIAKANDPIVASAIGSRAEKAAAGIRNSNFAATKAPPPVQKVKPTQPTAVSEPPKQKEKIQPLMLPENATHSDIDTVDTHSRQNSTKVPEQGAIITPKGKIVRFDKNNRLDMNTTNDCINDIGNDNYNDAHGKPYSAYKNLEQCIRDSANIRKLVQNTNDLKNLFKTATARNICSFYIKDYNAGTASMPYKLTKKIGVSGNPNEVGGFEKQYEKDGVLQSVPYDKNNPGVFEPGIGRNGFLKDTCSEWKFIQWFLKTYPDLSKVNCDIWFYSDRPPCKTSCTPLLRILRRYVKNKGGQLKIEYVYDRSIKTNSD